ncbi:MAG: hypothetical protein U5L00_17715 [Desulfovermiculus sp.]|nr:hypothetical protein [Desulfovermiculus sp.]
MLVIPLLVNSQEPGIEIHKRLRVSSRAILKDINILVPQIDLKLEK